MGPPCDRCGEWREREEEDTGGGGREMRERVASREGKRVWGMEGEGGGGKGDEGKGGKQGGETGARQGEGEKRRKHGNIKESAEGQSTIYLLSSMYLFIVAVITRRMIVQCVPLVHSTLFRKKKRKREGERKRSGNSGAEKVKTVELRK